MPLLLRIPGGPRGLRVQALVRVTDLFPTLLEILGVEAPGPVEGRSLGGLLAGEPEPPRLAYADQLNEWDANAAMVRGRPLDRLLYVAMDRDWKLIHRARAPGRSELYHLSEDPGEARNLYDPQHPQAVRLGAALDAFDGYRRQPFTDGAVDPSVRRRLEALGYLAGEGEELTPEASP